MVPLKSEPVPRVAELPTAQKTWEDEALLVRTTLLFPAGSGKCTSYFEDVSSRAAKSKCPSYSS